MKITKADIITLKPAEKAGQTPVLIRIWTDEGIWGYGEAGVSIMDYSLGCRELLRSFTKGFLVGRDPLDTDAIYHQLVNTFWAKGNGGVIMAAISAIDTALWDIKGKYFHVPIYQLLGGKHRDRLWCYASQLQGGWRTDTFFTRPGTVSALKEACARAVDDGYTAVKIDFIGKFEDENGAYRVSQEEAATHLTRRTLRDIDRKLAAAREAIGPDAELILENHCQTNAHTALQFAEVARQYDPMFLEEPANPLEPLEYRKIREKTDIPLATGERSYTRRGFLPLLKDGLLDIVQPDLGNCGGITEGRKIADLAESFGATVQTHTCNTPISVAAALQLEAAIPNFIIHEHHTNNTLPACTETCVYDYQPVNGVFDLSIFDGKEGLGNELSEQALKEAQIETVEA